MPKFKIGDLVIYTKENIKARKRRNEPDQRFYLSIVTAVDSYNQAYKTYILSKKRNGMFYFSKEDCFEKLL